LDVTRDQFAGTAGMLGLMTDFKVSKLSVFLVVCLSSFFGKSV
jgi:hypothetical protein